MIKYKYNSFDKGWFPLIKTKYSEIFSSNWHYLDIIWWFKYKNRPIYHISDLKRLKTPDVWDTRFRKRCDRQSDTYNQICIQWRFRWHRSDHFRVRSDGTRDPKHEMCTSWIGRTSEFKARMWTTVLAANNHAICMQIRFITIGSSLFIEKW